VVEVEEEDSSVEFLVSEREMKGDQVDGTGTKLVSDDVELNCEG